MLENKIERRDDWLFLILGHCESRPSCCQLSTVLQDTEAVSQFWECTSQTCLQQKKIMAVGRPVISVGLAGERYINPYT